jgi:uncharacterized membrane protein
MLLMAALAYVLLPLSGLLAYFGSGDPRTRFHGLQSILFGIMWPGLLYLGSALGREVTAALFVAGALVYVALIVLTTSGRDPRLPVVGRALERAASRSPRS